MRAKRNSLSRRYIYRENNKCLKTCSGGINGSVEANWTYMSDRACMVVCVFMGKRQIWNYVNVPRMSLSFVERPVLLHREARVYRDECTDFE